jgi:hypothetical protein
MMGKEFSITPRGVAHVETKYRRIAKLIPHPDSLPTLEKLRTFEPIAPLFPRLRSGSQLFQRPSPPKRFPSNNK